jgi:putative flippase GtrA
MPRRTLRQLAIYLVIGGVVFCIDIGTFQAILLHGGGAAFAATIAFALAVSVHFALNRWANFRNFDRAMHRQARTYAVIATLSWLLTLLIIEVGISLGLGALVAKVIAVIVNIPVGFVAHRHLTFGNGIAATIRARFAVGPENVR